MINQNNKSMLILIATILLQQFQSIDTHVIFYKNNEVTVTNNEKIDNHYNPTTQTDTRPTCYSIEDMQKFRESLSEKMMSSIDKHINPCDDFYEYACGNWDKLHDMYELNYILNLRKDLVERLAYILTNNEFKVSYKNNRNYKGLLKAKDYYKTCMRNDFSDDKKPVQQYLDFVKNEIGFPAVDDQWTSDDFDLSTSTGCCSLISDNCLFNVRFAPIHSFFPILSPLKTFGLNDKIKLKDFDDNYSIEIEMNKELMAHYLKMFSIDDQKTKQVIDDIMKFGHKLLNYSARGNISDPDVFYVLELDQNSSEIFDWEKHFQTVSQTENVNELMVTLRNLEFFRNFSSTLFEHSDFEAIANYLSLKVLYMLHQDHRSNESKKQFCLFKVRSDFSLLIDAIYRDLYENHDDYLYQKAVLDTLIEMQIELIKNSDAYSEETKIVAIEKIKNFTIYLGYVDDPIIPELIELIENHPFTKNYYENNIESFLLKRKLNYHFPLSGANSTIKPLESLHTTIINAFYNRVLNLIQINAIILRPPFYDRKFPKSILYGGYGFILGHEISHAFDANSVDINEQDAIFQWTEIDSKIYQNRTRCLINQYNRKYFPELNYTINGTITLCENIADNNGLVLAYRAYKNLVNQMTYNQLLQEMLPHTDWNHLQTFFIAHAQTFCSTYMRLNYLDEIDSEYPFPKFRVNGALENFPEFAKTFNCPTGSPMNPVEKCSIF